MSTLWALVGLFIVFLVIRALVLDAQRCRAARTVWRKKVTTMAVASRARNMDELPDEFMDELRHAMHLDEEKIL